MTDQTEIEDDGAEVVESPEAPAAPEWSADDVTEAKFFGWKSPDEWAGEKPTGYIDDPRRYMERAQSFKPFKASQEKLEKLEAETTDRLRRLEAASDRALNAQRAQFDRDIASITAAKLQAVETADVARYGALERQEAQLRAPEPVEAPRGPDPTVIAEYEARNEWVRDPALRREGEIAIDAAHRMGMALPDTASQLAYAESVMKRKYPHMFAAKDAAPRAAPVNRVDGGGLGIGAGRVDTFAKLPSEAQAQFKRFVAQGLFTNDEAGRKQYADDY